MHVTFSPQLRDETLSLSKTGDMLTVNGEAFDLSVVPDGATLPQEAINSDWFVGPVERIDGELHVTLILPHGPNPSQAVAFPQPITVNEDGPIAVPSDEPQEAGE
ncbi:hypothetical protein [uncultured Nitratireductor sp.]|uniref:hypothetical protein n=1 Tax=uncultured Nitratireductor sp. TaxID=520953 RepID=UPI0026363AE1|nr:hypothetical protein [uncultured Nitratireductor sp.]